MVTDRKTFGWVGSKALTDIGIYSLIVVHTGETITELDARRITMLGLDSKIVYAHRLVGVFQVDRAEGTGLQDIEGKVY